MMVKYKRYLMLYALFIVVVSLPLVINLIFILILYIFCLIIFINYKFYNITIFQDNSTYYRNKFILILIILIIIDCSASIISYARFNQIVKKDFRYNIYINGWLSDKDYTNMLNDIILNFKTSLDKSIIGFLPPNKHYRMLNSSVTIDENGLRRELITDDYNRRDCKCYKILFLGGSAVFGMTYNYGDLPIPDMLEIDLNKVTNRFIKRNAVPKDDKFVVYNAGVPGVSIHFIKQSFFRFASLNPQIVIIYEAPNTIPKGMGQRALFRNSFFITSAYNWYIKRNANKIITTYQGTEYENDMRDLIQYIKKINAIPILVTYSIAYNESADEKTLSYWDVTQNGHCSAYALAKMVNLHNQILKKISYDTDIILVDSLPILNGRSEYFIDPVHLNKEGSQKLAELISECCIKAIYNNRK